VRERVNVNGGSVRATHVTGDIASALLDYARDAGIALVVLCSHGRSGLACFALGSIADRLLHHAAVPVLLVHAFGPPVDLARAVVPLDGSALAEAALPMIDQLARTVVGEVTLLRVIGAAAEGPEAERYLDTVARRLQQQGVLRDGESGCRCQVAQGDPAQVILDAAGADKLVVMATHGRSGLMRWGLMRWGLMRWGLMRWGLMRWGLGSVTDRVARGGAAGVLGRARAHDPGHVTGVSVVRVVRTAGSGRVDTDGHLSDASTAHDRPCTGCFSLSVRRINFIRRTDTITSQYRGECVIDIDARLGSCITIRGGRSPGVSARVACPWDRRFGAGDKVVCLRPRAPQCQ